MIDALISGRLHGKPTQRTGQSGKAFVTCQVRAAAGNGEPLFVSVIAFDEQPKAALLALDDGEAVALSGALTPKVWQPRNGGEPRPALDLVAHACLSAYHVTRKRKASAKPEGIPVTPHTSEHKLAQATKTERVRNLPADGLADCLPWE